MAARLLDAVPAVVLDWSSISIEQFFNAHVSSSEVTANRFSLTHCNLWWQRLLKSIQVIQSNNSEVKSFFFSSEYISCSMYRRKTMLVCGMRSYASAGDDFTAHKILVWRTKKIEGKNRHHDHHCWTLHKGFDYQLKRIKQDWKWYSDLIPRFNMKL